MHQIDEQALLYECEEKLRELLKSTYEIYGEKKVLKETEILIKNCMVERARTLGDYKKGIINDIQLENLLFAIDVNFNFFVDRLVDITGNKEYETLLPVKIDLMAL